MSLPIQGMLSTVRPNDNVALAVAFMRINDPSPATFRDCTAIESLRPAVKEEAQYGADAIVIAQAVESRGSTTTTFANTNSNTALSGVAYGNAFFGNANTTTSGFGSSFTAPNRRGKVQVIAIKFI